MPHSITRCAISTSGKIGCRGIRNSGNELTAPSGSLTDSFGMVVPAEGVLRTARQLTGSVYVDNDSTDANTNRPRELYQWGTSLLVNYTGGGGYKLSSFSAFATSPVYAAVGSYAPPDPNVMRMKFAELAKSLYWTTDAGLYALDVIGGTARAAGRMPPIIYLLDPDGGVGTRLSGNPSATGSWFAKNKTVAYRATCGKKDTNGRVIESAASARAVVVNPNDVTVAIGGLVRNTNVVTATVTAHKFRPGDILDLVLTGGDVGNFDTTNNVVTSVTATTIVWAETAANYTNVASVTITSGTKSIQLSVRLTADAAAGDFVRAYRTEEATGEAVDPGDECFLSYERILSSTDISNGYALISDTTPSDFLGDPLDSNDNSGEGVRGVNTRPPLCRDLCVWDSCLWGGHTIDFHRLRLRLIGTGSPNGLQQDDLVAVNCRVYRAAAEGGAGEFVAFTSYLPTENVARTAWYLSAVVEGQRANAGLRGLTGFDGDTGLGYVQLEQSTVASTMADGSSGAINAIYAATSRASAFADALASTKAITAASTSRTGSTVTVRCTGHGFTQGQVVMIAFRVDGSADANFPPGLKTVASVVDANNFTYTEAGSAVTLGGGTPYYAYATTYKSDDNRQPLRHSRPGIPDAWPLVNAPGTGDGVKGLPDGAEVLRIKPTPDGGELLVCLKNGDTYALGGQYPYNVRRVDGTATLLFADTLVEHASKLYGVTTQGICTIGSNGVGLVGLDIEDEIRTIATGILAGDALMSVPFGMSYESDRQAHFVLPSVTDTSGTVASANTRRHILHSLRGEFTKHSAAHSCSLVFRGADVMVAGRPSTNRLLLERKTLGTNGMDFAGQSYTLTVNGNQSSTSAITVDAGGGSLNLSAGSAVEIAGTYYRVTASGATSVTIDGTVTVADNDTFTGYAVGFASLTFAVEAAGVPGIEKQFRELQLHFGNILFDDLTVQFSNEHGSDTTNVTVTNDQFAFRTPTTGPVTYRVEIPAAMKQAALLRVNLQLAEALSYFDLYGYSVSYEPISERTGK